MNKLIKVLGTVSMFALTAGCHEQSKPDIRTVHQGDKCWTIDHSTVYYVDNGIYFKDMKTGNHVEVGGTFYMLPAEVEPCNAAE